MGKVNRNSPQRMEQLRKQHELNHTFCSVCPLKRQANKGGCKGCETYKELKQIGRWLISDSAKYNKQKGTDLRVKYGYGEVYEYLDKSLSPKMYLKLKDKGQTDKAIAEKYKVTFATFKSWKKRKGLTKGQMAK